MSWANEVRKLFGKPPIADPEPHCKHLYDRQIDKQQITKGNRQVGWVVVKECCKCGALKSFNLTIE
jgi:hypothetical protein